MRLFLALALAGLLCLGAADCYAESARLKIGVKIISKADWDRIQSDNAVTIDNFDDAPPPIESTAESATITDDKYLDNSFYYNELAPNTQFSLMDINDDGWVTHREYLISTGTPVTNSDFDQYDQNHDGLLTRDEVSE